MSNLVDRNERTIMCGRMTPPLSVLDSNWEPSQSNEGRIRIGLPCGPAPFRGIFRTSHLTFALDITTQSFGSALTLLSQLPRNEECFVFGATLKLERVGEHGQKPVVMLTAKIRTRSSGMDTADKLAQLLTNSLGGSTLLICYGGWIGIHIVWNSREAVDPAKLQNFG